MSTPEAGVTHDIVLYPTGDSIGVGLMVNNLRQSWAPAQGARFGQGHLKGVDRRRWWSWIQSRWDGGGGQLIWSGSQTTNKFAESHGLKVRAPYQYYPSEMEIGVSVAVQEDPEESAIADITPDMRPVTTTGNIPGPRITPFYNSIAHPIHVFEWSNAPMLIHGMGAWIYTGFTDSLAFVSGVRQGIKNRFDGKWVTVHTNAPNNYWTNPIYYSQTIIVSLHLDAYLSNPSSPVARVYRPSGSSAGPSGWYAWSPTNRVLSAMAVYDKQIWGVAQDGLVRYRPGTDSVWSTVGVIPGKSPGSEPNRPTRGLKEFNGKLYIGKPENLSVYDAGSIYIVEDFDTEADDTNFNLMVNYRGALYFNIKHKLYRLTTGGLLEIIQTPWDAGYITSGAVSGQLLYLSVGEYPSKQSTVWTFDAETGACFLYYSQEHRGRPQPYAAVHPISGAGEAFGDVYFGPGYDTLQSHSKTFPVIIHPTTNYLNTESNDAYLVTSMLDMGMPNLQKSFNRLIVDYSLENANDLIRVSYALDPAYIDDKGYEAEGAWYAVTNLGAKQAIYHKPVWLNRDELSVNDFMTIGTDFEIMGVYSDEKFNSITAVVREVGGTEVAAEDTDPFWYWEGQKNAGWGRLAGAFQNVKYKYDGTVGSRKVTITAEFSPDFDITTVQNLWSKSAEPIVNTLGGSVPAKYWGGINLGGTFPADSTVEPVAVYAGKRRSVLHRSSIPWTQMGTITGRTDLENSQKAFSFPLGFNAKKIMFMFEFEGVAGSHPVLRRYEVEYMPFPSETNITNISVPAADGIENRLRVVEQSGSLIATTLNSLIGSGIPHIVGLHWPTPHTFKAIVRANEPGIIVPFNQTSDFTGADYNISLEEA